MEIELIRKENNISSQSSKNDKKYQLSKNNYTEQKLQKPIEGK